MDAGVLSLDVVSKIIDGMDVSFESVPFMVLLVTAQHFCSGFCVEKNWVMTAGHCVRDLLESWVMVIGGMNDVESVYDTIDNTRNETWRVWRQNSSVFYSFTESDVVSPEDPIPDIALIRLENDLCKDTLAWDHRWYNSLEVPGTVLSITGYGGNVSSVDSITNDELRSGRVQIVDSGAYQQNLPVDPRIMLIAKGTESADPVTDGCRGDSGGPLYDPGSRSVVGITSWGYGCGMSRYPGVYTRVSACMSWVRKNIQGS